MSKSGGIRRVAMIIGATVAVLVAYLVGNGYHMKASMITASIVFKLGMGNYYL